MCSSDFSYSASGYEMARLSLTQRLSISVLIAVSHQGILSSSGHCLAVCANPLGFVSLWLYSPRLFFLVDKANIKINVSASESSILIPSESSVFSYSLHRLIRCDRLLLTVQ